MSKDYPDIGDEWVYPRRRGYKMMCCDCGLVHIWDFSLVKLGSVQRIGLHCRRDNRATAAARKARRFKVKIE